MLEVPELVQNLYKQDTSINKNFRVRFEYGKGIPDITNTNLVAESVNFSESVSSEDVVKFGLQEGSQISFEAVDIPNILGYTIYCFSEIDVSSLTAEEQEAISHTGQAGVSEQFRMLGYVSEQESDLGYPYYRIPYGKFIVKDCPRSHGAMTHRRVTAYTRKFSEAVVKETLPYEEWKQAYRVTQTKYTFNVLAYLSELLNEAPEASAIKSLEEVFPLGTKINPWYQAQHPEATEEELTDYKSNGTYGVYVRLASNASSTAYQQPWRNSWRDVSCKRLYQEIINYEDDQPVHTGRHNANRYYTIKARCSYYIYQFTSTSTADLLKIRNLCQGDEEYVKARLKASLATSAIVDRDQVDSPDIGILNLYNFDGNDNEYHWRSGGDYSIIDTVVDAVCASELICPAIMFEGISAITSPINETNNQYFSDEDPYPTYGGLPIDHDSYTYGVDHNAGTFKLDMSAPRYTLIDTNLEELFAAPYYGKPFYLLIPYTLEARIIRNHLDAYQDLTYGAYRYRHYFTQYDSSDLNLRSYLSPNIFDPTNGYTTRWWRYNSLVGYEYSEAQSVTLNHYTLTDETAAMSVQFPYTLKYAGKPIKYSFTDCADSIKLIEGFMELIAAFLRQDRFGKYKILRLLANSSTAHEIDLPDYSSFWWDEYDIDAIGTVKYKFNKKNGEQQEASYTFGPGESVYDLSDNYVLQAIQNASTSAIEALLQSFFVPNVQQIIFTPMDMTMVGLPYTEAGDYISVNTGAEDEPVVSTFMMRKDETGIQQLTDVLESRGGEVMDISE